MLLDEELEEEDEEDEEGNISELEELDKELEELLFDSELLEDAGLSPPALQPVIDAVVLLPAPWKPNITERPG